MPNITSKKKKKMKLKNGYSYVLSVKEIKWTWLCWQVLVDIILNEFSLSFILNKEFKYKKKGGNLKR